MGFDHGVNDLGSCVDEQIQMQALHSIDFALEKDSLRAVPHQKAEVICSGDACRLSVDQQESACPCRRRMLDRPSRILCQGQQERYQLSLEEHVHCSAKYLRVIETCREFFELLVWLQILLEGSSQTFAWPASHWSGATVIDSLKVI